MLSTLIYATLTFWLLTLFQASVIPFRLGDFIFLAIFVWCLLVAKYRQNIRFPLWGYWVPLVLGLGMANFLFFSLWTVVPYFITALLLTYLLNNRSKWIFRWKEGNGSILLIFLIYAILVMFIRHNIMQYTITFDFLTRFAVTIIMSLIVWGYMVREAKKGKIR